MEPGRPIDAPDFASSDLLWHHTDVSAQNATLTTDYTANCT
ncbi:hypothetical protein OCOJLMKI_0780 [Methylobacterium iners]|uniref:Uncharacterized protein n=1 Tax=Methylobacterium iners TaxID=418707 RepID=A0ABQ4RV57_9HYPH|nr:hypothetical protein OCOJLMKI_0780 [Methylobacterium iners]